MVLALGWSSFPSRSWDQVCLGLDGYGDHLLARCQYSLSRQCKLCRMAYQLRISIDLLSEMNVCIYNIAHEANCHRNLTKMELLHCKDQQNSHDRNRRDFWLFSLSLFNAFLETFQRSIECYSFVFRLLYSSFGLQLNKRGLNQISLVSRHWFILVWELRGVSLTLSQSIYKHYNDQVQL